MKGLMLIQGLFNADAQIFGGAEHDTIYSVGVSEIVAAGVDEKIAQRLNELNWFIDDDCGCLCHYV
jgi:hypothetical protein